VSIEFQNVSFTYPKSTQPALSDITFQVHEGELLAIVGPNGAGKSTLLHLLNGILKPTMGQVFIDGKNTHDTTPAELARIVSVTFQNPADQIFAPTIRREIEFGPANLHCQDVDGIVDSTLSLFHMQSLIETHPYDLLPAQRKLLTIASAVAMDTRVLAFDEPASGLSQTERTILMQVLRSLRKKNRTFIIISHDIDFFIPIMDRILCLRAGTKIFTGSANEFINNDQINHPREKILPYRMRLKRLLQKFEE